MSPPPLMASPVVRSRSRTLSPDLPKEERLVSPRAYCDCGRLIPCYYTMEDVPLITSYAHYRSLLEEATSIWQQRGHELCDLGLGTFTNEYLEFEALQVHAVFAVDSPLGAKPYVGVKYKEAPTVAIAEPVDRAPLELLFKNFYLAHLGNRNFDDFKDLITTPAALPTVSSSRIPASGKVCGQRIDMEVMGRAFIEPFDLQPGKPMILSVDSISQQQQPMEEAGAAKGHGVGSPCPTLSTLLRRAGSFSNYDPCSPVYRPTSVNYDPIDPQAMLTDDDDFGAAMVQAQPLAALPEPGIFQDIIETSSDSDTEMTSNGSNVMWDVIEIPPPAAAVPAPTTLLGPKDPRLPKINVIVKTTNTSSAPAVVPATEPTAAAAAEPAAAIDAPNGATNTTTDTSADTTMTDAPGAAQGPVVLHAPAVMTGQLTQSSSGNTCNGGYYGYSWPDGSNFTSITYANGLQAYACHYGSPLTLQTDLAVHDFYKDLNQMMRDGAAAEAAEPPMKRQVLRWGPPL